MGESTEPDLSRKPPVTESTCHQPTSEQTVRPKRRWWLRIPLCCLIAYILWCTGLYFLQDRLLFRRDLIPLPDRSNSAWGDEAVHLKVDIDTGGQVDGWFLPGSLSPNRIREAASGGAGVSPALWDASPQASPQHPAPLVVLFHGNAELIEYQSWFAHKYLAMGCSVLVPEYRGYGHSAGKPSEEGIVADAIRFYDQVIHRPDVDPGRVVFHGRSLGGGVAAQVAARRKPTALILECTFTSVESMAYKHLVPPILVRNPFRTDEVLPTLDIPVFIAHGTQDKVIPVAQGRRLRELARNATYLEYECGHNNLPPRGREDEHWRKIEGFLKECGVLERERQKE